MVAINTKWSKKHVYELEEYHSVACLMLELGRKVLLPEMLGFNSPTVTTPMCVIILQIALILTPLKNLHLGSDVTMLQQPYQLNQRQRIKTMTDVEDHFSWGSYSFSVTRKLKWSVSHMKPCRHKRMRWFGNILYNLKWR